MILPTLYQNFSHIQQKGALHPINDLKIVIVFQILRDVSGNSFISPPPLTGPGQKDPRLTSAHFERTKEEDHLLGLYSEPELSELKLDEVAEDEETNLEAEVHEFHAACPNCGVTCETRMKVTKIPYFKEVIIMATDCEACGSRTNEVKSGSGIEPKGHKITFRVTETEDLSRDVLKVGHGTEQPQLNTYNSKL
jgi:zinc finger protein